MQKYITNSGKEVIQPEGEIPFPPRAILYKGDDDRDDLEYYHKKIELPGKCYWCLGDWHKACAREDRMLFDNENE